MRTPKIIPPGSFVRLVKVDAKPRAWAKDVGRRFRIGYYNPQDGLDCIWLVNSAGEYEQTTDRKSLLRHFAIENLASTNDYFGNSSPPLGPLDEPPVRISARSKRCLAAM
jgi:hypothetical protein